MEGVSLGRYVSGSIITAITGLVRLLLSKLPLVLRGGNAFGVMTIPTLANRMCVPFTRMVAAATTKGPITSGDPVAVVVKPPM